MVQGAINQLTYSAQAALQGTRAALTQAQHQIERASPAWRIRNDRQRLDDLGARLETGVTNAFRYQRSEQEGMAKRLAALSPFAVLQRGYAIITNAAGEVIVSVKQATWDEMLDVKVSDGEFLARVVSASGSENEGEKK